jgi:hypothetical protein
MILRSVNLMTILVLVVLAQVAEFVSLGLSFMKSESDKFW